MRFRSSRPVSLQPKLGLIALALLASCGSSTGSPAPSVPVGNDDDDAGADASEPTPDAHMPDEDAASTDAASADPNAPLVRVLSPAATDDPNSSDVIASSKLTVRCEAKRNPRGELVDANSVVVSIYQGDQPQPALRQKAPATAEADVYAAEDIDLAPLAHGRLRVECSASDLASKALTSSASSDTLFDKGPAINFLSPAAGSYVSAAKAAGVPIEVTVRLRVTAMPLAAGDRGANVAAVKAFIGDKSLPALAASSEPDVYSLRLDLADRGLFSAIPATLNLRVEASNARAPQRLVSASLNLGVDAQAPSVTVRSPLGFGNKPPTVSGKVAVVFEVKDASSGVDRTTLALKIDKAGGGADSYQATLTGPDTYTATFDTGSYPALASLNITLLAKDNAGAETSRGLVVDVDSVPPWISLDPPNVRERFPKPGGAECSGSFDPLGAMVSADGLFGMVDDLQVIERAFRPAALLWDRPLPIANSVTALIDAVTPKLYVQHNTQVPLLIDADHDTSHECDRIDSSREDSAPTVLELSPLAPTGVAPLSQDMTQDPSVVGQCVSTTGEAPAALASDSALSRIISHAVPGGAPVVFAHGPTPAGFPLGGNYEATKPGWACLVATAADRAGNVGFSAPLRVCFKYDGESCTSRAPSCTDGCVIPARFKPDAAGAMPRVITNL